jgi:hypothetical protein
MTATVAFLNSFVLLLYKMTTLSFFAQHFSNSAIRAAFVSLTKKRENPFLIFENMTFLNFDHNHKLFEVHYCFRYCIVRKSLCRFNRFNHSIIITISNPTDNANMQMK